MNLVAQAFQPVHSLFVAAISGYVGARFIEPFEGAMDRAPMGWGRGVNAATGPFREEKVVGKAGHKVPSV